MNDINIDQLVKKISLMIANESGNILGHDQQTMVRTRLEKRMIDLGNMTVDNYKEYLEKNLKTEIGNLVSILTTHHTFFFREFYHFEYLQKNIDKFIQIAQKRKDKTIYIYSAACSRGHEVYSLSSFFNHILKDFPHINYSIFGTDIDSESISYAKNGVYPYEEVKNIPLVYLNGNWQRGTGDISHFAKIKNHIKDKCIFEVDNLLFQDKIKNHKFDIIFCRNVFIYLKAHDIISICKKFQEHLFEGGILITGLSENLKIYDFKKITLGPSVYTFDEKNLPSQPEKNQVIEKRIIQQPLKLLIVDDSPSIIKLLTKCFQNDQDFEIIGTANHGIQAHEFIQNNKVDVMTLDIHMPEMNGVEYLKNYYNKNHPKVIIVSSVSREETSLAQKAMEYGASDFVEKPMLNNIQDKSLEIKMKLKMAFKSDQHLLDDSIIKSFSSDFIISNCSDKSRVWFSHLSDKHKIYKLIKELKPEQPPLFIFFENKIEVIELIQKELNSSKIVLYNSQVPSPNYIYLCDYNSQYDLLKDRFKNGTTSVAVLGLSNDKIVQSIIELENAQILVEDVKDMNNTLLDVASDIFPWTSMAHLGSEYLAKK